MTNEKSHDARAVANYILEYLTKATKGNNALTIMSLLKLVYFAHGWSLAFSETPLVSQSPEVWPYGPVYPEIYNPFKAYKTSPLKTLIVNDKTGLPYESNISDGQKNIIEFVLDKYKNFSPLCMSHITHQEETPWRLTKKLHGEFSTIPHELMKEHYELLAVKENVTKSSLTKVNRKDIEKYYSQP